MVAPALLMKFKNGEVYYVDGVNDEARHARNVIHEAVELGVKGRMARAINQDAVLKLSPATLFHVKVNDFLAGAGGMVDRQDAHSLDLNAGVDGLVSASVVQPDCRRHGSKRARTALPTT